MPKRLAYRLTVPAYTPQVDDRVWWTADGRVRAYQQGDGEVPTVRVEEVDGNAVWIRLPSRFKR